MEVLPDFVVGKWYSFEEFRSFRPSKFKFCGIYEIKIPSDTESGGYKIYGGSSVHILRRVSIEHISELRRGVHTNSRLQNSVGKYGLNTASFRIVELCLPEDRFIVEQRYLDSGVWVLNIAVDALTSSRGREVSLETRQKISKAHKGRIVSDKTKNLMREAALRPGHYLRGGSMSKSHKDKIRASLTGIEGSDYAKIYDECKSGALIRDIAKNWGVHYTTISELIRIEAARVGDSWPIPLECPHCGISGRRSPMTRWHFDNCKKKEN
jgi:group I intron endonuclease